MLKKILSLTLSIIFSITTFAQLNPALDVQHYTLAIELNDSSNVIKAEATVTIKFTQNVNEVKLDLAKKQNDGKGMTVTQVTKNKAIINFSQDKEQLVINDAAMQGAENIYTINYQGEPADGLIISKNKFGHRTFFGD